MPPLVLALMALLLVWSAWPTVRPARAIQVTQALFDPSQRAASPADDTKPGASTTRSGLTVQAPGWLEADPFYIACTALTDGIVAEMLVLEGESVEAGQVVARLVDDDAQIRVRLAEAQVAVAQAEAESRRADQQAAETDWAEPIERQRAVAVGRAALLEAEAELSQLAALVAAQVAEGERLTEELTRSRTAYQSQAATEIEVIILEKRLKAQAARTSATEARRPMLEARVERLQAELQAAERHAELRIVERQALGTARAALVRAEAVLQATEAKRAEAALELERMIIRAPISGVVQRRVKAPGDKVMRAMDSEHSAHLLHLFDPAHIQVRVDVPLADAAHVSVGQRCEVIVEVLPDRTFAGEVSRITHEADLQKNTLQVKVRVLDPTPILKPEMLTRVKFLPSGGSAGEPSPNASTTADNQVLAPQQSLEETGPQPRVWVVRQRRGDRGVLQPVPVQVLSRDDAWVSLQGALRPGDLLAAQPGDFRAGQAVRLLAGRDGGDS